ncbi:unnamed protein product, partial [Polarella glacialis]
NWFDQQQPPQSNLMGGYPQEPQQNAQQPASYSGFDASSRHSQQIEELEAQLAEAQARLKNALVQNRSRQQQQLQVDLGHPSQLQNQQLPPHLYAQQRPDNY